MTEDKDPILLYQQKDSHVISPREILFKYLPFLPWVIAAVALSLLFAFLKLRYSPNIYSVSGTLLVKDPSAATSRPDKIEEMLFSSPNKNINDEMQVIRSRNMGKRVAHALGLELQYYNQGNIRSSLIMESESPFKLNILFLKDSLSSFSLSIFIINDKQFTLTEKGQPIFFEQPFETNYGRFSLTRMPVELSYFSSNQFIVSYASADQRALELVGGLSATQSGESNNILRLSYITENPRLGVVIVNKWMSEYQQAGLEEKKFAAERTVTFINEQLATANRELGSVEKNLLGYREKNRIIDPKQQSEQIFESLSEIDKEITKQGVQLQVVDNLIAYINDTRNPYRQVGSTLGLEEPSLAFQITEFNKLQVERETLLKTTTRSNPMVANMETSIEKLRIDILQNLRNIRQAYQLSINNLSKRNRAAGQEISQIPAREKELLDITRRQKILEQLYSFLLQKKLETSIASASTISNVRVIEPALSSGGPVMPNRRGTYIMALFIGLAIPGVIIFLLDYLNDRVTSRHDVQKATQAPIIGEVSHSVEKEPLVVSRTSRRFIAEQFRIIRTNLQYVLPKMDKAVILVTSSTSGEGKSFISTNIGAVMALTGKKTAILEFDIRKPKIMTGLNLARKSGITNFVIGKASFEDLPIPVPQIENLYVIPCGPIPPNPSELLLNERLDELMAKLREEFDMIIIDTAPVGLVSDAVLLGRYADASLYVVRHNYTYKKQLNMLDEIYSQKRLPKMSLVINDIKAEGVYGRYYGYGGSGYTGYGYGYGTEYFDDTKPATAISKTFKGLFKKIGRGKK